MKSPQLLELRATLEEREAMRARMLADIKQRAARREIRHAQQLIDLRVDAHEVRRP